MATFLTDVHTHSAFSPDGSDSLIDMVQAAQEKGVAFYGASEHVNYDMLVAEMDGRVFATERHTDTDGYFHAARHLQDDYAGVMNILVGVEFGYTDDARANAMYKELVRKHAPDFIVNSIHTLGGVDYWSGDPYYTIENGVKTARDKDEVYREYLQLVLRSVRAEYDYDIIGHIGYVTRYAPYADRGMAYADYAPEINAILKEIIAKDKILEVNSSNDKGVSMTLPDRDILQRYFDLGGRKVSFASDAHDKSKIMSKREAVVEMLKEIGFTYLIVPSKGEHIKVEI